MGNEYKPTWREELAKQDPECNYILNWHWDPSKLDKPTQKALALERLRPVTVGDLDRKGIKETWSDRMERMLIQVSMACSACSMCSLGRKLVNDKNTIFDPHVFSNMKPSKWMVIGQNPGLNECMQGEPFVGDAGKNFNKQLARFGLKRDDFYICNTVRCYTIGNETPTSEYARACEPFLRIEINLLKPVLLITLGKVAFDLICPDLVMRDCLGEIVRSTKFDVDVYAIYHPSPRNLSDPDRLKSFLECTENLCRLVKAYKERETRA